MCQSAITIEHTRGQPLSDVLLRGSVGSVCAGVDRLREGSWSVIVLRDMCTHWRRAFLCSCCEGGTGLSVHEHSFLGRAVWGSATVVFLTTAPPASASSHALQKSQPQHSVANSTPTAHYHGNHACKLVLGEQPLYLGPCVFGTQADSYIHGAHQRLCCGQIRVIF